MKNKGLIITMIILLSLIVVFLIAILILGIMGKFRFSLFGKRSTEIVCDEKYELKNIENIKVISSAGDIRFEESEDEQIRVIVYGRKDDNIEVNKNESTLLVKYTQKSQLFGFNISVNDIIIYIPKDYKNKIEIDASLGDIEILSLENASIKIEQNCGDIKLGKIKNVEIDNDLGTTEIEEVLNKLNIKSNCGDIKIKKVTLSENSNIENDLGDVKIGETNDIYIDAHCDLGDEKIRKNNRQSEVTLKIDVDCGDIKVEN